METHSFLLGFLSLKLFLAMLLFAGLGIAVSLLIHAQKRDQTSKNTPEKFSFLFLLKDNWKSIVLTALIVILTLRFATSFFPQQFTGDEVGTPQGIEKWLFGSLVIGLGFNQLIQVWKDKSQWLRVKRTNGT
jgi:hypothetical protein